MSKKGDQFEIHVYEWLCAAIDNGTFGISPNNIKLHHQHKIYSKDRDSEILFDIVVEVYRTGAKAPYLYWIWECKDYSHAVPVNDIEEFHSKLEQIGRDRIKGTIISTAGFQKSVISLADTYGIGLMRVVNRSVKKSNSVKDKGHLPSNGSNRIGNFPNRREVRVTRDMCSSPRSRARDIEDLFNLASTFLNIPERSQESLECVEDQQPPSGLYLITGDDSKEDCFAWKSWSGSILVKETWNQILSAAISELKM